MSTDIDHEPKPRKYTGLRVALGFAAGMAGIGAGCAVNNDGKTISNETPTPKIVTPAPQPDLTQPQLVPMIPAVSAAEIPTQVPTPKPTEAPVPTATATARPAEPSPSATATVKVEPSSTPTTVVEKPKSAENPLPRDAAFYGLIVDKNGKKVGEMFMSSTPDEVFWYWIDRDKDGLRTHQWGHLKPINVKGTHFEIGGTVNVWVTADYNEQKKTIAGTNFYIDPKNGSNFELNYVGEGKKIMLATVARIMHDLSSDQPNDTPTETKLKSYIDRHFP